MDMFLRYLRNEHPQFKLKGSPGTKSFNSSWKQLAENPQFADIQHDFIEKTHYAPAKSKIQTVTGFNADDYSDVVKDALWSTAVQHGITGATNVFKNAGITQGMNPEEVIRRVYQERGANNGKKYFSSSNDQVRQSVVNRFKNEMQNALSQI